MDMALNKYDKHILSLTIGNEVRRTDYFSSNSKYPNWTFRANLGLQKNAKMVGSKYRRSQTGPKNPNKTINSVVITTWGLWLKKNEIEAYL